MRKLYALGLACAAVLAFCAIAASAAFAESEWLVNGEPAPRTAAETSGELSLSDDGTGTTVLCSGEFIGTVGGGAGEANLDQITDVTNLSLVKETTTNLAGATVTAVNCTYVAKGACSEANGSLVWVIPIHLPWNTEVTLDEGIFVDKITTGTGGEPGYETSCKTLLGTVTDVCEGKPGAVLTNGVGDVSGEFKDEALTNPAGNCSVGGAGQALTVSDGAGLSETAGTLSVS